MRGRVERIGNSRRRSLKNSTIQIQRIKKKIEIQNVRSRNRIALHKWQRCDDEIPMDIYRIRQYRQANVRCGAL